MFYFQNLYQQIGQILQILNIRSIKQNLMKTGNTVRYNKFTFADHSLALKVRGNMLDALTQYDINNNGLFQQPQIIRALVQILHENQNQIRYVIANVFRYDKDGDKAITYDEFVNFSVQQHFGQMAIQRLHRNQLYSRGKQRIMNADEFQVTLNECLKYIEAEGKTQQYNQLFSEIDLDHDGWIKYEDYFMFLREYFGSMSFAANQNNQPQRQVEPVKRLEQPSYQPEVDFPQERFARLIYTQLKISVMQHDLDKSLHLDRTQVGSILQNVFRIPNHQKGELIQLILGSQEFIQYERFMKIMVPFYFCEYDIQKQNIQRPNESEFVNYIRNACSFIRVKPTELVLRQVFRKSDSNGVGYLQKNEYINILGNIFQNYEFDNRGKGQVY